MLCSSIEDVVIGGKSCEAFSFCAPEIHFDLSTRSDSCRWMTHGRVDSTGNYYRSYWNRIPNPGLYDWICAFLLRNLRPQYPRFEFSAQFLALIKPQYGPSFPATPRQGPSFFPRLLGFFTKKPFGDTYFVSVSTMRFLTLQSSDGTCWRRTTGWTKLGNFFQNQLRQLNYPILQKHLARPLRVSKRQGHIVVHIWDFQTDRFSPTQKASCCCQGVVKRSQCPRSREWGRDGAGASMISGKSWSLSGSETMRIRVPNFHSSVRLWRP